MGDPVAQSVPQTVAVRQFVAASGVFPESGGPNRSMFVMGMVHSFAGAPGGWVSAPFGAPAADGTVRPIQGSEGLFSVVGAAFGGDGAKTFALPDLRGKAVVNGSDRAPALPVATVPMMWLIASGGPADPGAPPPPSPVPWPHNFPPPPPMPPAPPAPPASWVSPAPLTGMLAMFAGTEVPSGWLVCDGSMISAEAQPALHAVLGRAFGWWPDGHVALPNLGEFVPMAPPAGPVPGQSRAWIPGDEPLGQPFLVLSWLICVEGDYPSPETAPAIPANVGFLGQIVAYAGQDVPAGWMACDGTLLSIAAYEELFVLLENDWGGDGITTFALPDLRGKVPVGG